MAVLQVWRHHRYYLLLKGAKRIQTFWRDFHSKQVPRRIDEQKVFAAGKIRRAWHLYKFSTQDRCIRAIQRRWRLHRLASVRDSSVKIQRSYRNHRAVLTAKQSVDCRRIVVPRSSGIIRNVWIRHHDAIQKVMTIQKCWRLYRCKCERSLESQSNSREDKSPLNSEQFESRDEAASIQESITCYHDCQDAIVYVGDVQECKMDSLSTPTCHFRPATLAVPNLITENEDIDARRILAQQKNTERYRASSTISRFWRVHKTTARYHSLLSKIHKIQKLWRGFSCRKKRFVSKVLFENRTIRLQSLARQVIYSRKYAVVKNGAVSVQKWWKNRRLSIPRIIRRGVAAIVIIRFLVKCRILRLLSRLSCAASLFQRSLTGAFSRQIAMYAIMQTNATLRSEHLLGHGTTPQIHQWKYLADRCKDGVATVIQCVYRGYKSRRTRRSFFHHTGSTELAHCHEMGTIPMSAPVKDQSDHSSKIVVGDIYHKRLETRVLAVLRQEADWVAEARVQRILSQRNRVGYS